MRDYYILFGAMAVILLGPVLVLVLLDERDRRKKRQQTQSDSIAP